MKPVSENRTPSPDNYRKVSKPLIEKKRRARINASLNELKGLLETVLGAEIPRDSKMEKADILELAVKHLKHLNRQIIQGSPAGQYRTGYGECASETSRYLGHVYGLDTKLRTRLMNHLASSVSQTSLHNHHMTSSNNVMSSHSLMTSQVQYSRQASPIYLKIRDVTNIQPITNGNGNYITMSQPISDVQTSGLLMTSLRKQEPETKVWRPW